MNQSISILLSKLSLAHRTAAESALSQADLHYGQAKLLSALRSSDGLSQAELMRELCVTAPTVNGLVSKLEKQGLVVSRACPDDKRLKKIFLTVTGRSKESEVAEIFSRLDELTLKGLSEIERNTAMLILNRILGNLTDGDAGTGDQ